MSESSTPSPTEDTPKLIESGLQPRDDPQDQLPLPRYVKRPAKEISKGQRVVLITIITQLVTLTILKLVFGPSADLLGMVIMFSAANVCLWFLWTQAGRFKWFAVGIATAIFANSTRNPNAWLYLIAVLFIILWRDESLRDQLIQKAKVETRGDFVPKPWFQIGPTEEEVLFGKQDPPRLTDESESAMQFLADRLRKKI